MSYDNPHAVWILFGSLFLLGFALSLFFYRKRVLEQFNPQLVLPRSPLLETLKLVALLGVWILATLALMQPKGNAHYLEEKISPKHSAEVKLRRKAHEIILLIDVSASMSVPDSRDGKTRLSYAKDIADQFASRLNGESVSLYAFTYDVAQLSPATIDELYVRLLLRSLKINEGDTAGTSLLKAMQEMRKKYLENPASKMLTLLLFTDGQDNQIQDASGENEVLETLNAPGANHLRLFTIGMGSAKPSEIPKLTWEGHAVESALNSSLLKKLAAKGRGDFFEANAYTTVSLVDALFEALAQDSPYVSEDLLTTTLDLPAEESVIYTPYFQIPLGIAVLLFAFYIFGPNTTRRFLSAVTIFFSSVYLTATPFDARMQEAAHAAEAGQIAQAHRIYAVLLTEPSLLPWERQFIAYDDATVTLEGGDPEQALDDLNGISIQGDPYPLLVRRLLTNKAIAYLKQGESLPLKKTEDYESALYLLREGLARIRSARKWDCEIAKAQGATQCPSALDLDEIQRAIKIKLATIYQQYIQERIQKLTPVDATALLLAGVQQVKRGILFLQTETPPSELKERYSTLLQRDMIAWDPLWKRINSKTQRSFDRALKEIKQENWSLALSEIEQAEEKLTQFLNEKFQGDPFQAQFERLLGLYRFAIAQDPPFAATLEALKTEQAHLLEKHAQFKVAQVYLEQAVQAQQNFDPLLTRFYLEAALFALSDLSTSAETVLLTPSSVLEKAVVLQVHALTLNRLIMRMNLNKEQEEKLRVIAEAAQSKVVAAANRFTEAVLREELQQFNSQEMAVEERCQAHPWDEVLPLYLKGLELAKKTPPQLTVQNQVLSNWRDALEVLKKPKSSFKGGCLGSGGGAASKSGEQEQNQALNSVLKDIQAMDQDDRQSNTTPAIEQKGIKPW